MHCVSFGQESIHKPIGRLNAVCVCVCALSLTLNLNHRLFMPNFVTILNRKQTEDFSDGNFMLQ